MATATLVRGISGFLRKTTVFRQPIVSRLSSVAITQNSYSTNIVSAPKCNLLVQNKTEEWSLKRNYSGGQPLTLDLITSRVLLVLKLYDKVDPEKLKIDSHFINDLGLDSLDHVEVIMAMEDEFGFEIPDGEADRLLRPKDIIQYIADKEDVFA